MKKTVAIVTGASQGIGRATAIRLAKDFSGLVLVARNGAALKETAASVSAAGAAAIICDLDLSKSESAALVVEAAMERFGRIDALLNIAGAVPQIDLFEMTDEQWRAGMELILVATGRTPNSDRLHAEKGDVRLDSNGYVQVNEFLQTSAPDVWALGECAGSPKFTHVGYDDCMVVLDNLAGGHRTTRDRLIPYCVFTDPELAHIGLTESQAKAGGIAYRLAKMPWAEVMRSHTLSETRGFCKALVGEDNRILGFTAFGAEASEMMAAVQIAMLGKLPYTVFRDAILAHPTTAEGLRGLFSTL